jgi:hypothetical protein
MKNTGALIVSWDFSHGKDYDVLLVGQKKPGKDVEVINAFKGEEAFEIYEKLTTKKAEVKPNG